MNRRDTQKWNSVFRKLASNVMLRGCGCCLSILILQSNVLAEDSLELLPLPLPAESASELIIPDEECYQLHDYHYYSGPGSLSPFAPPVQYDHSVVEVEPPLFSELSESFLHALETPAEPLAHLFEHLLCSEHVEPHTDLDRHAIGIQPVPERPPLLLELNEEFLAPGFLRQGIVTPTGAIWRPSLWVFGTFRTGINHFENGTSPDVTEWANRLDLFTQLNLSGTERVLLGLRPLDEQNNGTRQFSGYDFRNSNGLDGLNDQIQTLFFEGDFGEVFPYLDPYDRRALDYGFSIGRQPMSFQQGLLLNEDRIDALTITRNTLNGNGILNYRGTFVYAWNEINRDNLTGPNVLGNDNQMIGYFTETDIRSSTINADFAYVWSNSGADDLAVMGLSSIQRIHGFENTYNSSAHILASFPTNGETNLAGQGELLFHQLSWTPHHTNDLIFLNTFWGIDQFTSASRGPLNGGPLGQTGLLFSAAGLGNYGAPLDNNASNVIGASLGYQLFFCDTREQIIWEIGGRQDTDGTNDAAIATGIRYQKALNQHWFLIMDTFASKRESTDPGHGIRFELQSKF